MSNRFSCEITVPDGFTVTEEHVTMPLDAAARLLRTKRRRRYTSALKCADTAVLTRHFFTCPHCRRRTPAYPHFALHKKCIPSDVTRRTVAEWSAPQLSMFENDNSMLYLNKAALYPLQLELKQIISNAQILDDIVMTNSMYRSMPTFSMGIKMAAVVLTMLPIMCVFPFLQKYFVKGVTLGSVKG